MMSRLSSGDIINTGLSLSARATGLNSTTTLQYGQSRLTNVRRNPVDSPPSVLKTLRRSPRVMPGLTESIFSKTCVNQTSWSCVHGSALADCVGRKEAEPPITMIESNTTTRRRRIIDCAPSGQPLGLGGSTSYRDLGHPSENYKPDFSSQCLINALTGELISSLRLGNLSHLPLRQGHTQVGSSETACPVTQLTS